MSDGDWLTWDIVVMVWIICGGIMLVMWASKR